MYALHLHVMSSFVSQLLTGYLTHFRILQHPGCWCRSLVTECLCVELLKCCYPPPQFTISSLDGAAADLPQQQSCTAARSRHRLGGHHEGAGLLRDATPHDFTCGNQEEGQFWTGWSHRAAHYERARSNFRAVSTDWRLLPSFLQISSAFLCKDALCPSPNSC